MNTVPAASLSAEAWWTRAAGCTICAIGFVALLGWAGRWPVLAAFTPHGFPMPITSAICAIASGLALWNVAHGRNRWGAAGGAVVTTLALAILFEYVTSKSIGIDHLLWKNRFPGLPGGLAHTAPNVAIAFLVCGLALLQRAAGSTRHWWQALTAGCLLGFTLLPLLNFAALSLVSRSGDSYQGMALPTACCLVLLAAGVGWQPRRSAGSDFGAIDLFAASLGVLLSVDMIALQATADAHRAQRVVAETFEAKGAIDRLVSEVARMESTVRAYALTGQSNFRARYFHHRAEVLARLDEFGGLAPAEEREADQELIRLANDKFRQSETILRARDERGASAAADALARLPTTGTSALVTLADRLQRLQSDILSGQQARWASAERHARSVQIGGSVMALYLLGFAVSLTRRSTARRVLAETELTKASATVAASEERFRQAFEFAGIGMAIVGLDGRWVRVNKSVCDIIGYSSAELLGMTFQEVTYAPDLSADLDLVRTLISGERRFYQMEKRYVHKDGHLVWIRLTASIVRDNAGQPLHFVSQIEDIAVAKQNEAALRESERTFQQLFESSPDAIFLIDGRGMVSRANWRSVQLFGWSREELAGRPFVDVLSVSAGAAFGPQLADFFRTPRLEALGAGWDVSGRRLHGDDFPLEISLSALPGEAAARTLVVARDITKRKVLEATLARARDEAVTASRMKSDFLANMSHEIRTPMNAIVGMTDLLRETPLSPDQERMVASTQAGAESLLRIIDDILDYSKLEAGKMRIASGAAELRELIHSTVSLLAPRAQAKDLAVAVTIEPDHPVWVRGDAGRIRQVLTNLVGNAIKFTDRGSVTIRMDHHPLEPGRITVRIGVRDTGIGLSQDARAWLFQPFSQADATTTRSHGGTGLGLAISKHLVESMGGTLGVESTAGLGSVFWFQLHLPAVSAGNPAAEAAPVRASVRPLRLLLVEDNEPSQAVALGMLGKLGHEIDLAENGRAALSRLASAPYDAVLMDCQMPEMDGFDATRQIRAGQVPGLNPEIPVIGVTAYASPGDHERCRAVGMNDVLSKPVRLPDLHAALLRLHLVAGPESVPADPAHGTLLGEREIEIARRLPGQKGPSLLPELIARFLADEPRLTARLKAAVERVDAPEIRAIAHSVGGEVCIFGAVQVRDAALRLEKAAAAGAWPEIQAELAGLRRGLHELCYALARVSISPSK